MNEMPGHSEPLMTLDAEIRVPVATTRLVQFHVSGPADDILRDDEVYWLDLCLTPRPPNVRACLVDRWSPSRFEPVGDVFILPPRETLRARSDGGPSQTSILLHLRPDALRQWFDGDLTWTDRRVEAGLDLRDENIRRLLLRLAYELRRPGFASETLVELIAAQMTIELGRYCAAIQDGPATGGLAPWRLRLIEERLREVGDLPSLAELAALCKLSVRQLTRAFRASRGRSIGDYLAQCRIDHAKRLLSGDGRIKTIAHALGFASPSSFSFAFRLATGETPREFRERQIRERTLVLMRRLPAAR